MSDIIKPLKLGNRTFPVNIVQAPLAGYTCAAFRRLLWRYSKPAFCCTEMISCKSLLHRPRDAHFRYIVKDPDEGPLCFQLFGDDPKDLAVATKIATDFGADLIDLNCGCPVTKVRRQGAGSSLLTQPAKIAQMITAMKQNTTVPVSIKVRIAHKSDPTLNLPLIQAINSAAPDFVVVHGRHWSEGYDAPCHYDQIKFFVDNLTIPVIGNGGIHDLNSLHTMFATGCAGAMIGRAGIGQPWLIAKLIAAAWQREFSSPTNQEIGAAFIEHIEKLATLLQNEKFAILEARKMVSHYARGLVSKKELCTKMNSCVDFTEFHRLCREHFI